MMNPYLIYDRKSFPLVFEYPADARYSQTNRKKYFIQVNLRETKDKFRRLTPEEVQKNRTVGGGSIGAVFPKISITLLKAYVPASQTPTREARFMDFDEYVAFCIGGKSHPRHFCPQVTDAEIDIPFGRGRMVTYRHPSDTFYRSQVFVADHQEEYRFLNILYKHHGTGVSNDELNRILQSIKYIDRDCALF